jgi:REP element-mobilizing transposase RayT
MARPLRIDYPGSWHHVTSRGNERKNIFRDDRDRLKFLEILTDNLDRYHVQLHGYVLMANHFHLLLKSMEGNLKHFMQRFNTSYTVYFNRRHHRIGHLFQGRYKAILVQADAYLLELSRYIHLNPVRIRSVAGQSVQEQLAALHDYAWSSYPGYVSQKAQQTFVTYSEIYGMVGGQDIRACRRQCRSFVEDPIRRRADCTVWDNLQGQTVLGDDGFMKWLHDRFVEKQVVDEKEQPGVKDFPRGPSEISEIAKMVAQEFAVEDATLYQPRSSCREARAVFLALCCGSFGHKMRLAELGKKLGGISNAALCLNRKRLAARMEQDVSLRQRVGKVKAKLI